MKKKKKENKKKASNLRTLIVCIGVVMIWRAVWDFCDIYIFPDNKLLSDIVCLVVGLILLFIDDGKIDELH